MKIIKYQDNYKETETNDKVIMVLIRMLIIFGTFTLGIAIGASLAFKGKIEKPSYCYEDFENAKNNINEIEVKMDDGSTISFNKKD